MFVLVVGDKSCTSLHLEEICVVTVGCGGCGGLAHDWKVK
jgi:hypothetical protein